MSWETRPVDVSLDQQIMLAIMRLQHGAHGALIVEEIERRRRRRLSPMAVYTALEQLRQTGLIPCERRKPAGTDGRAKRYFTLTADGDATLNAFLRSPRRAKRQRAPGARGYTWSRRPDRDELDRDPSKSTT